MENSYLKILQRKRIAQDRRVTVFITLGGWLILVTLLLMIWHLLTVTVPMTASPQLDRTGRWSLPENATLLSAGNVAEGEFVVWSGADCSLSIAHFAQQQWQPVRRLAKRCSDNIKVVMEEGGFFIAQLLDDARFRVHFSEPLYKSASLVPVLSGRLPFETGPGHKNWQFMVLQDAFLISINSPSGHRQIVAYDRRDFSLLYHHRLSASAKVSVLKSSNSVVAFDNGSYLHLGTELRPLPAKEPFSAPKAIYPVLGDNAFLTSDRDGYLSRWAFMRVGEQQYLQQLYRTPLNEEIKQLMITGNHQLALLYHENSVSFVNSSTGELLATSVMPDNPQSVFWMADDLVSIVENHQFTQYKVQNGNAVTTMQSLWGEVWYDGYPKPDYVWQTSSAEDHHQAKFSIVPLFIGSMKAALLAVLVAIPVGLGCAIYVGYFARQKTRRVLKPVIELIEGIPSVVIGFIAAIWLLPVADTFLLALFLFVLLTPLLLLLFSFLKQRLENRWHRGWELWFVSIALVLGAALFDASLTYQQSMVNWFWSDSFLAPSFAGDSAKNTIILAIALGFAIAPTVFSIAEDAINEVPAGLLRASFAMGADQLQTLQRIVLRAAFPGILSAVMLGFARALGETMIVLMVSGNTPVSDWNLLEGFRTLTANLAIELPEANPGELHYQILFLTALLLFVFTFCVNTLAELLRQKLKIRYQHG